MRDTSGPDVTIDWLHFLVHSGRLHRMNLKLTGVAISTGCNIIIDIPQGVELHWFANYYSKFGGILEASYNPLSVTLGTEVRASNCHTEKPGNLKTKFYHTNTATHNPASPFSSIGIAGGTSLAGTGTSGAGQQSNELILKPGKWFVEIKPYADDSVVIFNADVYETGE